MIGQKLGHNRVVGKIGEGGMGAVYRGVYEHLHRDVAIKILPAHSLNDDSARRRFRKEAHALSRLNHPNIEAVYDFDADSGVDYLVIEYVEGLTLRELLERGPLPEKEILRLSSPVRPRVRRSTSMRTWAARPASSARSVSNATCSSIARSASLR